MITRKITGNELLLGGHGITIREYYSGLAMQGILSNA